MIDAPLALPPSIVWSVISGLGGAVVALVIAHFTAGRDLAYMKGQLSQLMHIHERVSKVEGRQAVVEEAHKNLRSDVNKLGAKVRSSTSPTPIRGA